MLVSIRKLCDKTHSMLNIAKDVGAGGSFYFKPEVQGNTKVLESGTVRQARCLEANSRLYLSKDAMIGVWRSEGNLREMQQILHIDWNKSNLRGKNRQSGL